jgi:hypothetical protein
LEPVGWRLEVAHRAFRTGVVALLSRVAGEAQGAVGNEARNDRGGVAGIAGDVPFGGGRMGSAHGRRRTLGMTGGAPPALDMVVVVTRRAARDGSFRVERRLRRVTGDALQGSMPLVLELGGVDPRLHAGYGDAHRDRRRACQFARSVAPCAVGRLRRLVMADLAAAGGREGEPAVLSL